MFDPTDILISVSRQYVTLMLTGDKTIELRRRTIQVAPGTRVWIYTKVPHAKIEAVGIVEKIVTATPSKLWQNFQDRAGISFSEFEDYFLGTDTGCAIVFDCIRAIDPGLTMTEIRRRSKGFHPPQFFKRLDEDSPELKMLLARATKNVHRRSGVPYGCA